MLGNIKRLQQKSELANLQFGDLFVAPIDLKTQVRIKLLGKFSVSAGTNVLRSVTGLGSMDPQFTPSI
jgi:hypothetical protein